MRLGVKTRRTILTKYGIKHRERNYQSSFCNNFFCQVLRIKWMPGQKIDLSQFRQSIIVSFSLMTLDVSKGLSKSYRSPASWPWNLMHYEESKIGTKFCSALQTFITRSIYAVHTRAKIPVQYFQPSAYLKHH